MLGRGVVRRHNVVAADGDAGERRWLHRKRLRGRILLAGRVAFRHGALFDREHRLARHAIEDEHVADLARLHQRWNFLPSCIMSISTGSGGRSKSQSSW